MYHTVTRLRKDTQMRFVSVRDLRGRPGQVWRELASRRELVVTSNGKPIAILSAVSEEGLEESLRAIRRARALAAVDSMQSGSLARGRDRITGKEVEAEIAAVRRGRAR